MKKRRPDSSDIAVGDLKLVWSIEREPQWCTADGWKGLAVSVRLASGTARELLIQFPFEKKTHRADLNWQRPGLAKDELERQIRRALADGWDPESRGKRYVFDVAYDA